MKGRPRDPKRARRQTGHRRKPGEAPHLKSVPAPASELVGRIQSPGLEPPADLPKTMHATWDRVIASLGPIVTIRPGDAFVLEAFVRQYHRMKSAGQLVEDYGVLAQKVTGDVAASPFLKAERDAAAMVLRFAEHYGLTVASRMKLGLMTLQGETMAQALNRDLAEE